MKKEVLYTSQAEKFILGLPQEVQNRVRRTFAVLELEGRLLAPMAEKVEGHLNLYEVRVRDGQGQYRVFYAYAAGNIVWALSGFQKKTPKTPVAEIRKALRIKKEIGL